MQEKYDIKFFSIDEIGKVLSKATDFYHSIGFADNFGDVREMLENSQGLVLAYNGDEIVGAGRLIGDGTRYDHICDLNVKKDHRKNGIGKRIARTLAGKSKAHFVSLTTDPRDPGLIEFYKKAGFEQAEKEYVFEWSRDENEAK